MASNVTKATTVGAVAGGGGAVVIGWLAALANAKWQIPNEVGQVILGTVAGLLARWAAKLNPDL